MNDSDNCEHEITLPFAGGEFGETECRECGERFLFCPGCSQDSNLNHAPSIYHAEPLCKASLTKEEFIVKFNKSLNLP